MPPRSAPPSPRDGVADALSKLVERRGNSHMCPFACNRAGTRIEPRPIAIGRTERGNIISHLIRSHSDLLSHNINGVVDWWTFHLDPEDMLYDRISMLYTLHVCSFCDSREL